MFLSTVLPGNMNAFFKKGVKETSPRPLIELSFSNLARVGEGGWEKMNIGKVYLSQCAILFSYLSLHAVLGAAIPRTIHPSFPEPFFTIHRFFTH